MGRKRSKEENHLGLPPRCYAKHGAFWYVHRENNRWEHLGTDLAKAKETAKHYNDPNGEYGTVAWFLDEYLQYFSAQVKQGKRSLRTRDDYTKYSVFLKTFFGKMSPVDVKPHHVAKYLEIGEKAGRGVQANREKACLSSMFSWMRNKGLGGIEHNPCAKVGRNSERPRQRYVTDEELDAVMSRLTPAAGIVLELAYLTLQRPEDIVDLTRDDIVMINGREVIRFVQGKHLTRSRQVVVHVAVNDRIRDILARCRPEGHLIVSRHGERYTTDGIGSMIRRHCEALGIESFGPQDIKAKGATDMALHGTPVETIQELCGHAKIETTQRYIKRRRMVVHLSNNAPGSPEKSSYTT